MVFLLVVENVVEKINLICRDILQIIEYLNNLLKSYDYVLAEREPWYIPISEFFDKFLSGFSTSCQLIRFLQDEIPL